MNSQRRFATFAFFVLAYNIPVILWGAYVRVSFSGDGCGADWPFCAGHIVPQNMARPMAIEFTHRMMTSLDLLLMGVLLFWAFRVFPRGHIVRRYSLWSAFFLFMEALLGAGLVIFRKVAHDQSAGRAVYLSAHLTNTMLLLGAIAVTAWLAKTSVTHIHWERVSGLTFGSLFVTVLVSVTGALAALGDTLFPAGSLAAGMQQDFSNASNMLLRLRLFHPAVAIAGAAYLLWGAFRLLRHSNSDASRTGVLRVIVIILVQLTAGAMNLGLLAPVWMQMLHLAIADVLWIAVIAMVLDASRHSVGERAIGQPVFQN